MLLVDSWSELPLVEPVAERNRNEVASDARRRVVCHAEVLQGMLDSIARLREHGLDVIED